MVVETFHFYSITFRKREKFYSFSTYSKKGPTSRKNSSKFYQRSVISSIYVSLVCRNEPNPSLSFDFDFSQTMQLDNTALAMNKINDRQVEFTKIKLESQCFANLTLIRTSTCPFT